MGEVIGTKLLMSGVLPEVKFNTSDLFPGAPSLGKAVFKKSDLWNFVMPMGRLISLWAQREDNMINWSIKMSTGGCSRTIKFPKHEEF